MEGVGRTEEDAGVEARHGEFGFRFFSCFCVVLNEVKFKRGMGCFGPPLGV